MPLLPINDKHRKHLPIFRYLTRYCPKAIREMTAVSVVNNVRYNPEREPADINWARDKSRDQLGSGFRHMLEHAVDGKVFEEVPPEIAERTGITRVYILAENAWRAVAALELEIERVEAEEAAAGTVVLHEEPVTLIEDAPASGPAAPRGRGYKRPDGSWSGDDPLHADIPGGLPLLRRGGPPTGFDTSD